MEDSKMMQKRYKEPKEFGDKKYLVELFIMQRHVITVFADDTNQAAERARQCAIAPSVSGGSKFLLSNGVKTIHYDEDFFEVRHGEVQKADADDS